MEYHGPAPAISTRSTWTWPSRRKCPGGTHSGRALLDAAAIALENASLESDLPFGSAPKSTTDNEREGRLSGAGTISKSTRSTAYHDASVRGPPISRTTVPAGSTLSSKI